MKVPEFVHDSPTVKVLVGGATKVPIVRVNVFVRVIDGSFTLAVTVGVPAPLFVMSRLFVIAKDPERRVYVGVPLEGLKRRL